jgi:hypothetical protein
MGFLHSNEVIVDAVLTKKGRQLLAEGSSNFKITKFAISDEGVDYRLYNPDHPSGSNYYGEAIENMPMLEAISDDTMTMRYKLITLPKGTSKMPIISATPSSISITWKQSASIIPNTLNALGAFNNNTYGYTCILSNSALGTLVSTKYAPNQQAAVVPS